MFTKFHTSRSYLVGKSQKEKCLRVRVCVWTFVCVSVCVCVFPLHQSSVSVFVCHLATSDARANMEKSSLWFGPWTSTWSICYGATALRVPRWNKNKGVHKNCPLNVSGSRFHADVSVWLHTIITGSFVAAITLLKTKNSAFNPDQISKEMLLHD